MLTVRIKNDVKTYKVYQVEGDTQIYFLIFDENQRWRWISADNTVPITHKDKMEVEQQ